MSLCVASSAAADGSRGSGGSPGTRVGWPCSGCVTVVPPGYSPETPAPLFVALHGDEGSTKVVLRLWKTQVEKRGYILLALLCPKEKGCSGSYWRWAGSPDFMLPPLDAVEAAYNVDRERIYLSGWSGGSTYMGMSAPHISPRFAALNLNAGGMPPEVTTECNACKAPVYYFMGGRNPLAYLAEAARDYYKRCGHDVTWDFARDLDHPGELLALSKATREEQILAWLDTKRNACAPSAADEGAGPGDASAPTSAAPTSPEVRSGAATSAADSSTIGTPQPSDSSARPGAASPQPGCGCRGAQGSASLTIEGVLGFFAMAAWRRRRSRLR